MPVIATSVDLLPSTRYYPFRRCYNSPTGYSGYRLQPNEEHHAKQPRTQAPPFPEQEMLPIRLWEALPQQTRQEALRALSRMAMRQLLPPPDPREVGHEQG